MKKKLTRGVTLVEVVTATAVFAITFAAMLVGQNLARSQAENSLISFLALQYGQGVLETLQGYPYEEPLGYTSNPTTIFTTHHNADASAYDLVHSGVYVNETDLLPVKPLPKESLTLQYHPTNCRPRNSPNPPYIPSSNTPFEISTVFQNNGSLLGPENNDVRPPPNGAEISNGIYKISQVELDKNFFRGEALAKYYFMDDVDDFDGYAEVRNILPNVPVTFTVSVCGVSMNAQNFSYPIKDNNGLSVGTAVIQQNRFSVMQPIALPLSGLGGQNLDLFTASLANQEQECAAQYYDTILFKKITILVQWEYPIGSGRKRSFSLEGGVVNPKVGPGWV
jgi:hypothetical protein